jgi:polysaccharide transporter, PST family
MIPLYVLNRAIFPHNANKQDRRFATKALFAVILITIVVAVADFAFSPLAVRFFGGDQLMDSVFISRVLCLWVLIGGVSIYEGSSVLVAFGHVKPFNYSVLLSSAALLLLYGLFYLTDNFTLMSFAFALIFAEFFIAIYRFYFCIKYKLFSFQCK